MFCSERYKCLTVLNWYFGTKLVSCLLRSISSVLFQDVKPILKQRLIERKEAVAYMEPEKTIISRSGDECVVALCDQVSPDFLL